MERIARLLVLLLWLPAGCDFAGGSGQERMLRVHLNAEPVSLDPALAEDGIALRILANTMEGLVGYDGGGNLVHRLAESHEMSSDGKRFVFRIRDGAVWSDGRPVRAEDFVRGIRRALDPAIPSKQVDFLLPIRGAKALRTGKA